MAKKSSMFVAVNTDELMRRVVVLSGDIWREHYPAIISEKQIEYMLNKFQSLESIQDQIKGGTEYYLVTRGGEAVGYFAVREEEGALFLSKLYVLKSASGCGLGSQALDFIKEHWKPMRVYLTVNKENAASIRFYESRGFTNTGEVVQEIGGGFVMDDYQMEWVV